ncbi:MAG: hypothetical protein HQL38_03175 [Alphaproteobacteria bacterium]|nr:hypothetical protein [Alphaproteobacteria bacterium]
MIRRILIGLDEVGRPLEQAIILIGRALAAAGRYLWQISRHAVERPHQRDKGPARFDKAMFDQAMRTIERDRQNDYDRATRRFNEAMQRASEQRREEEEAAETRFRAQQEGAWNLAAEYWED